VRILLQQLVEDAGFGSRRDNRWDILFGRGDVAEITCLTCGKLTEIRERTRHLTLEVELLREVASQTVQDAVNRQFASESVERICRTGCSYATVARKVTRCDNPPQILIVQLKRMAFDLQEAAPAPAQPSARTAAEQPQQTGRQTRAQASASAAATATPVTAKQSNINAAGRTRKLHEPVAISQQLLFARSKYRLRAVSFHIGETTNSGHYTTLGEEELSLLLNSTDRNCLFFFLSGRQKRHKWPTLQRLKCFGGGRCALVPGCTSSNDLLLLL
jgi:hypothetical protein